MRRKIAVVATASPSPLRGGVRGGGREAFVDERFSALLVLQRSRDPHPQPLPSRGRGAQEPPDLENDALSRLPPP